MLVDARVSADRIEGVIREAEKYVPDLFMPAPAPSDDEVAAETRMLEAVEKTEKTAAQRLAEAPPPAKIILRKVTATRAPENVTVLHDITFDVTQPGLVVITGGNASGKTSLLLSILNELTFKTGVAMITPRRKVSVAYSAHEPWIVNATAKVRTIYAPCLPLSTLLYSPI